MRRFFVLLLGVILTATGMQAQSNPFDALRNPGDPRLYEEHKAQWLARVEALPRNVDVLEGAADFFMIRDRPLAQGFLERARDLEPDSPRWPRKLAQLHKLNATRGDQSEARLALAEMERADAMTPANERSLPTALAEMAFDAGDIPKARAYADQLLTLAKASPKSWDYGNAVHKGHLVLGRIAVREGRIVDAVGLLRASGETPGSPQLNSFGPNMSLAKDLLEHREIDAVLAYLELCRVFWKMGGGKLDAWVQEVKAGRVPNFGANLQY
jgi:hypothetical protein